MAQLADFYKGNTKRWRVTFPTDIAGSTVKFRMARSLSQNAPDLEIQGVLDDPDVNGEIFGATMEITAAVSTDLAAGEYFAEHELTTVGLDVTTFLPQKIRVKTGVPKA